jgi:hypothetical protein
MVALPNQEKIGFLHKRLSAAIGARRLCFKTKITKKTVLMICTIYLLNLRK